ncbi:MAG TPA: hypothetical protein PKV41_04375, partial [Candidatus Omnitrophota bacterium]|nr:hypothetical protein [Candidatus Omnitrophota bacterium]
RLSFLLERARSGPIFKKALPDIKGLNKILKVCILALAVYLVGNFLMSLSRIKKIPEFGDKNSRAAKEIPLAGLSSKKVNYYLDGPRGRDIFKFGDFGAIAEKGADETDEVTAPVVETLSQSEILAQQLGLVGIGWSDDPDVMVENTETKKIYFLKRGQKIEGRIKVEAIFEDKVVLTYDNGKEMELR